MNELHNIKVTCACEEVTCACENHLYNVKAPHKEECCMDGCGNVNCAHCRPTNEKKCTCKDDCSHYDHGRGCTCDTEDCPVHTTHEEKEVTESKGGCYHGELNCPHEACFHEEKELMTKEHFSAHPRPVKVDYKGFSRNEDKEWEKELFVTENGETYLKDGVGVSEIKSCILSALHSQATQIGEELEKAKDTGGPFEQGWRKAMQDGFNAALSHAKEIVGRYLRK